MKRLREGREEFHLLGDKASPNRAGLLRPGIFSLLLHLALAIFLILNLKSAIPHGGPSVYRVTIRPFLPPGDGLPQGGPSPGLPGGLPALPVDEKPKSEAIFKRTETGERAKSDLKKTEKKVEKPEKGRVLQSAKKERMSGKSLQEALEDIRIKAALEGIQKKVARRERLEKGTTEESSTAHPSQGPIVSRPGTGSGTGTGSGPGGLSTGGSPGGSPGGGSALEAKLKDYCDLIWAKIKKEWTLPEDLPKGKIDLEAVIVVIIEKDGKVQKSWFEKRSGNGLYDQMAMRAIKKAEPFPPIPTEFSDETFEFGIRFHPD